MANWNEREQEWRGDRGRREMSGARNEERREAGYNPAGPSQNYHRSDRGSGYDENRSWSASRPDYGRDRDRDYGDGGPTRYGQTDFGGDSRRFGQGGYDRSRYGEERFGPQGYSGQSYGDRSYGSRPGYGTEWYDRDSYDSRRADGDRGYRDAYGGQRYGRDGYRSDYRQDGRETGFGDPNPYVQAATDGETQGHHAGRGPKDYRRSDDRIREDVNDRLTDDAHIDASGIQVAVKDGEVTLSGTVDSRFAKRHAEDLAERISGVRHLQNNLRVQDQANRWDQGRTDNGATTSTSTRTGGDKLS